MSEPKSIRLAGLPGTLAAAEGRARANPVLFVHGAFGSAANFTTWQRALSAAGYDAYAFSRRGRDGTAPPNAAGVSLGDYLEDVLRAIDDLPAPPIVAGHSMGGQLAIAAAAARRVPAVLLLAPYPPNGIFKPWMNRIGSLPRFAVGLLPWIVSGRPWLAHRSHIAALALHRVPVSERAALLDGMVHESGRAFREMMLASRVDLSKVACPVWCAGGAEDRIVPPAPLRALARALRMEITIYPDHGHWLPSEPGWEKIASDAIGWLERVGTAAQKDGGLAA